MKGAFVIILTILSLVVFSVSSISAPYKKSNKEENDYWSRIQHKRFYFKITDVLTTGPDFKLIDNSMLSIYDTTLVCYLPIYTGLDFISHSFSYNIRYKKRECIVTIQNTIKYSDHFLLYVTKDGYGNLKVIHPDGSGISFRGIITNE